MGRAIIFYSISLLFAWSLNAQTEFITTWKTDNPGISNDNQIQIPGDCCTANSYQVDWGDGNIENAIGTTIHTYASSGIYTVTITGNHIFYFNNEDDKDKLLSVEQWGARQYNSMENMFYGCSNLVINATDTPDVSNVSSFVNTFRDTPNVNFNLANWDISSAQNMNNMLTDSGLSTVNYDATLLGWSTLDVGESQIPLNVTFGANPAEYCNAINEREVLINTYNWTITDGGNACSPFVTTWETTSTNESITIPIQGSGYNYTVNWGDGNIESGFSANATHSYADAGTHTVQITGDFPRIYFPNSGSNDQKIKSIEAWGDIAWTSMEAAFYGCSNLVLNATDAPNLDVVLSIREMFRDAIALVDNGSAINTWDISNVTDLANLFRNTPSNPDVGNWDTSSVQFFGRMFQDANNFDRSLANWDISSTNSMGAMFANAGISTANYDATLIGWRTLETGETQIPTGISLNAGNSQYCASAFERNELITSYNWTITDNGPGASGCDFTNAFITTWETTTANESITIPTIGTGYNYFVDWGDGTRTHHLDTDTSTNASHTYASSGVYTVKIVGAFPRIHFNETGDKDKLLTVEQWGDIKWTSTENAFMGCTKLQVSAIDAPNLSSVTNIGSMFRKCTSFNSNINHWDVSNIQIARRLFSSCINYNQPLDNWNTESFTVTSLMFQGATNFNQDISNWNVSNVEYMTLMFNTASNFNQDISNWDTNKVISMEQMFRNATAFNQDLEPWGLSNVTNMVDMFLDTGLSTENYDATLIGWNTDSSGTVGDGIDDIPTGISFNGGNSTYCLSTTQRDNLINAHNWTITDNGQTASSCSSTNPFITTWETKISNESITIPTTGTGYNYSVDWGDGTYSSHYDTNASTDATHIYTTPGIHTVKIIGAFPRIYFNYTGDRNKILTVEQWGDIQWASMADSFSGCLNFSVPATDAPDLSNVTSIRYMFSACIKFNDNINHWDVSNVTEMLGVFSNAATFNQPLNNWDMSRVRFAQYMFRKALLFNQDLGDWDISKVMNMKNMFLLAGLSTENYDVTLAGWNTDSSGTDGDIIDDVPINIDFNGGSSTYCLSTLDRDNLINTHNWIITDGGTGCDFSEGFITTWETTTTNESITIPTTDSGYSYAIDWGDTTIEYGFSGNATHTYTTSGIHTVKIIGDFPRIYFDNIGDKDKILTVEQWGNINWTSMNSAFQGCKKLQVPAIDAPNLSNVVNMGRMFSNCTTFNSNINHWNVSNIQLMNSLFEACVNYNQPLNNWDVSAVTSFHAIFERSMFNQEIGMWNIISADIMSSMFEKTPFNKDISNWDTSNVTDMLSMFQDNTAFNQDIKNWNTSNVAYLATMFRNATSFNQNIGNWDLSSAMYLDLMFKDAGLSTENYDATLIGWNTDSSGVFGDTIDDVPTNVIFDGGNSNYCISVSERDNLINTRNWTITDGGVDCGFSEGFITTWQTTTANESITIPTTESGYNYLIDWGDNTIEYNLTGDATHIYTSAGIHTIKITGDFPRIYFNNTGDKDKLLAIEQWGAINWISMSKAFRGCSMLQVLATDAPNLSNIEDMDDMFKGCISFNSNVNHWNVINIKDMDGLFEGCVNYNQPLNNWDVSSVTKFGNMFSNTMFNQDISMWDTNMATNMAAIFQNSPFNGNISNWDTSNVANMSSMFRENTEFNQDISDWDTSNVAFISDIFRNATAFDQNLGNWDISRFTFTGGMFQNAGLSTENYDATLIGWNTDYSGTAGDNIDDIPTNIIFNGGNSTYCVSTPERNNLINTHNWTIADGGLGCDFTNAFITTWETTSANESITIPTTGSGYNYGIDWGDNTIEYNLNGAGTHTYTTAGVHTIKIIGNFPTIYFNLTGDKDKILSIEQWGNIKWRTFFKSFYGCSNLSVNASDAPDLTRVSHLNLMFANSGINQNINHWDVSNITQMYRMFFGTSFNQPLNNWDTSNVTYMRGMFHNNDVFNGDISNWDVGKVQDFSQMFLSGNSKPFTQNLANWNIGEHVTTNTITMWDMFKNCVDFNADISSWDVSKVNNISGMFHGATSFDQNLSSWDITNIGNGSVNPVTDEFTMEELFFGVTLSTENYDAILIGWHTDTSGSDSDGIDDVPSNIIFDGGNSTYCQSTLKREDLINSYNWAITDNGQACNFSESFITTWETTTANESITIPTTGSEYQYAIDWGDGTIDYNFRGNATHTYTSPGTHTVKITGDFPRIWFSGLSIADEGKILTVEQWGTQQWISMKSAFKDCYNLKLNASDTPNLSQVTTLRSMFEGCTNLEDLQNKIGDWNVSTIEILTKMFELCTIFNENIGGWDFDNLTNTYSTFEAAATFNQDISNWDVSNVSDLDEMFRDAISFNQPIGNWTIGVVDYMNDMFNGAIAFNQDLSNWDFSNAYEVGNMFEGASSFNQDLSSWDISNAETLDNFFTGSAMSQENYDNTLIGWATLETGEAQVPPNLTLNADATYCLSETQRQELIDIHGWTITDGGKQCDIILLNPKVYLQGAALNSNSGEESLMRDDLRVEGLIPTLSPYLDGKSCSSSVFAVSGTNAIVDWVWVELRDENDNTTSLASQSALLQRDGDIVDIDGSSALTFSVLSGNYYIVIKHRNHLGIMTSTAITLNTTNTIVDFTDANNQITYGTEAQTTFGMSNGVVAMWAGDANADGTLSYSGGQSDVPSIRSQVFNDPDNSVFGGPPVASYPSEGYYATDVNMDGLTVYSGLVSDVLNVRNGIFNNPSNSVFGGPPTSTYVFNAQLPEN